MMFTFILGLMAIAALVGGLMSFYSLFSKQTQKSKLLELELGYIRLEQELRELKLRLDQTQSESTGRHKEENAEETVEHDAVEVYEETTPVAEAPPSQPLTDNVFTPLSEHADELSHSGQPQVDPIFSLISRGISCARNWLLGGNTLVRSGIVILFIGVSFLIKYAAEHSNLPIEIRLSLIALFGVALLVIGWRLRDQRPQYAWSLQGGGIGVLYLTIFAAMKLYQLIPVSAAFVLMIVVAFLSALIAVLQSALPLAILAFIGGFLAPIFTSTGQGGHVGLFSYYLVLNLAIAFIAIHKSWRSLNVLGFAFTFVIGTLWGVNNYSPEHFASTEPFLIIHFLLFTLIAVLYAHRQATKANDYVDATLVFGTPLIGFSLQYALLRDSHFGLAYSALTLGIFYIILATWVFRQKRDTLAFLGECFLALGIGFATITLPLALDGRWTSAAWAVEGVGLLWVGLRQGRMLPLLSGMVMQILAAIAFLSGWGLLADSSINDQNMFLGAAFVALSGWACGALLNAYGHKKLVSNVFALWGWVWWVGAGLTAIDAFYPSNLLPHLALVFVAFTSLLLPIVADKLKWPTLALLSRLLLAMMGLVLLIDSFNSHPFEQLGFYSWLIAFGVYMWLMRNSTIPAYARLRAPLAWIAVIIGIQEWQYQFAQNVSESEVWRDIGWAIVPMVVVAGIIYWQRSEREVAMRRIWLWIASAPIVILMCAWFVFASLNSSGNAAPLTYLPLLNPLDIALCSVLLIIILWARQTQHHFSKLTSKMPIIVGVMIFALCNGMLLRTLHHWTGTPFQWTAIFSYPIVQMSFTFLWAISAFILMLLAHKHAQRPLWMVGVSLVGLVVAKIFLLDLAQHGTVERIASFIGTGLILLVMGYFAPMPPAASKELA